MIPPLHIRLLGELLLVSGETAVTSVDLPRLQSLLAYLVLHRTGPQSRAHLAYQLWPDSTDAQALTNLRNLVHKLRQALPNIDAFLSADRQTLFWQPGTQDATWALDVLDFETAIAQADHASEMSTARRALEKAVDVYRGDLLPSCYDEWILPERDRLRQAFLKALERLIGLQEQERDYAAAIGSAQRLLRHDPLHEVTYRQLMRLYVINGDRASALRIYHNCATVLERELATEPSRATREAYEHLMQMKEPIAAPEAPRTALLAAAPLVGRQREWAQLQTTWRSTTAGRPHLFILSGEAGIGKTRLAEELLTWAGRQGITTAAARCYAAEGMLAYAPVTAWLRSDAFQASLTKLTDVWLTEVARFLPNLLEERPDLPRPGPLMESWQRQHLFEALARAILLSKQPLLLLLDDAQWCESETLEWLHYLLRFDPRAPLLLIGTVRSEEMTAEHPLVTLLTSLRRDHLVTEVALEPLNAIETAYLAAHLAGHDLNSTVLATLYRETEGNPLFVVETVRVKALAQRESAQPGTMLPPTVQAVIASRLSQLSPAAREVGSLAAVIGRAFTFTVLSQASGSNQDSVVRGLDELWQRRIIREQGGDAYDFSHDKLREEAYTALSAARRRLLHRQVAEALEKIHANDLDTVGGQLAMHYEHAGLLPQAISSYQRAGKVAQQVYAHAEAIAALRRALTLLETTPPGTARQEQTARLHEGMGDSFQFTGQYNEAELHYHQALAHVQTHDHIWQARLHRKLAKSIETQHRYEEAMQGYNAAESALSKHVDESVAERWQEWIQIQLDSMWTYHMQARTREMNVLIEKMQPVVESYGTAAQATSFFIAAAIRNFRRDRYVIPEETLAYADAALAASQKSGNARTIAQALFSSAFCRTWHGDLNEAQEQFHDALKMAERAGDALLQSQCLTYLAIVYRKLGQVEETRCTCSQALIKATEAQRLEDMGMTEANLAWVAWRLGNLVETQAHAHAALDLWQALPLEYPFRWTALWPLLAQALTQAQIAEAVDYARTLLHPLQERLPDTLTSVLEAATQAWNANEAETARTHLQQAITLAQKMRYL
jgi:DNA-binding SARP family transcriptional activator